MNPFQMPSDFARRKILRYGKITFHDSGMRLHTFETMDSLPWENLVSSGDTPWVKSSINTVDRIPTAFLDVILIFDPSEQLFSISDLRRISNDHARLIICTKSMEKNLESYETRLLAQGFKKEIPGKQSLHLDCQIYGLQQIRCCGSTI